MAPSKFEIQKLQEQGKHAYLEFVRTGDMAMFYRMVVAYGEAYKLLSAQKKQSPIDPLINTAGRNVDNAEATLTDLQRQLEAAGDNPPPGLLAKIQIATQAYQAWFTCLKSCADSKGQVQSELARFR